MGLMEVFTSAALFDKLQNSTADEVEVSLKNNSQLRGIIIGFFFGIQDYGDPFILKWHLVEKKDRYTFGKGVLGSCIGTIFSHKELISIRFLQDDSVMKFQ
ncbi:MAG: hypothetical protein U5K54_26910 [Cytophagales bacterium]|nr:hypothetical protein [Cytophagales bacterium]